MDGVVPEAREDLPSATDLLSMTDLRSASGVLVMAAGSTVLYINQRGWQLIRDIIDAQAVKASGGLLPAVVGEVCQHLQALRRERPQLEGEQREVSRMVDLAEHAVLVRGILLPAGRGGGQPYTLILLEPVVPRQKIPLRVRERFGFTDREEMVVKNLAKGLTNKEIASQLSITESTVKAYIKQIMRKTKCSTRTGILVQVLSA